MQQSPLAKAASKNLKQKNPGSKHTPGQGHGAMHKYQHAASNKALTELFEKFTSALYVEAVKIKGFHWNIIGDQFFPLHACLDTNVDDLFDFADQAAEIIRQIDDKPAPMSMTQMVKLSPIKEIVGKKLVQADEILPVLVSDFTALIHMCNEINKYSDSVKRQDLSDFVLSVRQYLDKYKWQFNSANK